MVVVAIRQSLRVPLGLLLAPGQTRHRPTLPLHPTATHRLEPLVKVEEKTP